jgi:hypothetical protein
MVNVNLSWTGATVVPPQHAVYKTDSKLELAETPTGIGDETLVTVTTGLAWVDSGVVAVAPALLFYKVLPADSCGQAVYP